MQIDEFGTLVNLILLTATYLILQPLKAQITNLVKSLDVNSEAISKLREMLNDERIHVAKVDESVKSAHRRLDEHDHNIEEIRNRCVNCQCRGE